MIRPSHMDETAIVKERTRIMPCGFACLRAKIIEKIPAGCGILRTAGQGLDWESVSP